MPWTEEQLREIYPEPNGWAAVHYRQPMGEDCWFGPFVTREEALQWATTNGVSVCLVPLYLTVDWRR